MQIIDTHAHLTSDELFDQVEVLIKRAKDASIFKIFNINTDLITLKRGLELKKTDDCIENIAACTPHDVDQIGDLFFNEVKNAAKDKKLLAIGETGLDYYYMHSDQENQKKHFEKYIHLALEFDLPLVIHCRNAFDDLIKILDRYKEMKRVIIHCFTGTDDEAKACLSRGFYLSFSGIVTYKKSLDLQKTCAQVPIDRILIETDAPYLAPQNLRGKVNEPAFIVETLQKVAFLHGITVDKMAACLLENTKRVFGI
jgi:TatD DNase family protein